MVHAAPRWQRGKIARAVAGKAAIAARVDIYGEGLNKTLLEKLNVRVEEIGKKYKNPVEKDSKKDTMSNKNRDFKSGRSRDFKSKNKKRKSKMKNKKRKKFGRR